MVGVPSVPFLFYIFHSIKLSFSPLSL
jgi:hypothetical protein